MKAPSLHRSRSLHRIRLASGRLLTGVLSSFLAIGAAAAGTASSNPSHEYLARPTHFFSFANQSLVDDIGPGLLRAELGGSVTTNSGASSDTSAYTFEPNGGPTALNLQLADGSEYTIELSIRLDDPINDGEGTIKALDFTDLQSDYGVYVIDGRLGYIATGGIQSSPSSSPTGLSTDIQAGIPTHITITRRADTRTVSFFTNGIAVLSMIDTSNDFVIGGDDGDGSLQSPPPLRIFQDDTNDFCSMVGRPPRCDSGSGSIEYIKIYDTALTGDDATVLHIQGKDEPEVVACLCDSANGICVDDDTAAVPQLVNICIRCDQDGFLVALVNDFWYEQGAAVETAVQNGTEQVPTVVSQRDGYTMVSTILSEQFYSSANISPIVVRGSVDLTVNPTVLVGGQRRLQPSQIRIAATVAIVLGRSTEDFQNTPTLRPTPQNIESLTPSSTPSAFVATRPPHLLEPTDRGPTKRRKGGLVVNLIVSGTSILFFGSVTCGVWKVGRYVMAMRQQRSEAVA